MSVLLLAFVVLQATGCSFINGNCNAQGGTNSVNCGTQGGGQRGQGGGQGGQGGDQSIPGSKGPPTSLFNIAQTPNSRQKSGTLTYDGQVYSKPFQLDLPWGSSASYSYALNDQWSEIYLVVGIPDGGNGGANIKVSVYIDGQPVGDSYIVLGNPYSGQFSVDGVKTLTISFDTGATLSATAVLVAGNLYR